MVWTDEQIEMLKTLWREGKPASEIATFIGCDISRNAIIGKAHRLGLAGRASPIKKKKEIKLASLSNLTERMWCATRARNTSGGRTHLDTCWLGPVANGQFDRVTGWTEAP